MAEFVLPDLGEGLTEAEIVCWLVQPGDVVEVDQIVVEVESAKSSVELPSPFSGRVETLYAAVGQVVQKGMPLLSVVGADAPTHSGSGAVLVGYGTKESTVRLRRPEGGRFGGRRASTAVAPASPSATLLDPARHTPVVSPIVRKLARENGFDAGQLAGGEGGLVRREDVEAAIAARAAPALAAPALDAAEVRIPITGIRKLVAERLAHSRRVIPEATVWLDVDATELLRTKDRLQKTTGERFSLTALIARFVVAGLKQYPQLNSSVDEAANEIVQHGAINLGLAAQTPRGLMVPVVHGAHDLTTRRLRDEIATLVTASEKGAFPPAALSGGTFTLNNYGGFGVDGSAAIINHPEAAMLGVGRVIDRPWVHDGEIQVRKLVTLTIVFDHRVCDGDVAAGYLTYVARCVEEPLLLLSNL